MTEISKTILRQMAREKSMIITKGNGPFPVYARGDRRTVPTHWLARETVMELETRGIFARVPRGLILSKQVLSSLKEG